MKKLILTVSALIICLQFLSAQSDRKQLSEKIDTTNLELKKFALSIVGDRTSNYDKANVLLDWVCNRLAWLATDYKSRTVKEILARSGGNCFELAKVYMAMIKELNIEYRPIAEINIHKYSDDRQQGAAEKVKTNGNRMSVFGRQHNDHRWVEIYDDRNKEWIPVDPSMNVIGTEQWLKARVWFGKRVTIDTALTNDMIVPFVVFVVSPTSTSTMTENRTQHYLVDEFNKLYQNRLSALPAWKQWVQQVDELDDAARDAFAGKANLHEHGDQIAALAKTYSQLKEQYLSKYH